MIYLCKFEYLFIHYHKQSTQHYGTLRTEVRQFSIELITAKHTRYQNIWTSGFVC